MHTAIEQNQTPPAETPKRYQCRHIFTDGRRCGSPSLRGEPLCYYHHTTRKPGGNPRQRRSRRSTFHLPLPEDRSAIQSSIGQVLQRIAANDIDLRRAGLLLYGLQIASLNLPKQQPAAKSALETANQIVEEITTDPELGILAPPAEVGQATKRKSTIAQLLEKMIEDNHQNPPATQSATLPTLQAAASDSRPPNPEMPHLSRSNAPVEPLRWPLRMRCNISASSRSQPVIHLSEWCGVAVPQVSETGIRSGKR